MKGALLSAGPAHPPRRKRQQMAKRASLQEHTTRAHELVQGRWLLSLASCNTQTSQGLGCNPANAMHTVVDECLLLLLRTCACRETTGQPRTSTVTEIAGQLTGLTGSDAAHLLFSVRPALRGIPAVGFAESLSLVIPSTSPELPVAWITPMVPSTYDSQLQQTPYQPSSACLAP